MERKFLSVFVASPNDLTDERKALRDVVKRLNKINGKRIGWQIELLGWEDTLAGFSRPQALINKDVENCDLFIGMLWKRWGTDSGAYSSGFEEEFSIARDRRLKSNRPEIWIFFKRVDEELFKDPGEQLKKTLEFKKQLIDGKELLFKEFEELSAFRDMAFDDLCAYLLDIHNNTPKTTVILETESPVTKSAPIEQLEQANSKDKQNNELIEVFRKLSNCLGAGDETEIEYWERVRAYLSTSALFSQSHIGELFGTHETNLVYRKRNEWNLSSSEKWFLIKTYFGDSSMVVPGWYWLSDKDVTAIENILFLLSKHDRNSMVRKGALLALSHSNTSPPLELISALLQDNENDIVIEAIRLLKYCEGKNALKLLEPLLTHQIENVRKIALSIYIDLIYLYDPEQSFTLLKDKSTEVTSVYKSSLKTLDLNVSKDLIISSVFEAAPRVREYAADYLYRIGALTTEISEKILKDPDPLVRKIGFDCLLNNGREFSLSEISTLFPKPKDNTTLLGRLSNPQVSEDDVIPLVLSRKTKEELEDMVDFYSGHGKEAYEALAITHSSSMAERLRSDLNNHFEKIKSASIDKLKSEYGDKASILLAQYKTDLEQLIKDSFVEAALKGLAIINDQSDIRFAREYLGKLKYGIANDECLSIIEKYGDDTDIDRLISVAESTYGPTKRKAVITAIKLSGKQLEMIQDLVHSEDKGISEIAAEQIYLLPREDRIAIAKNLLHLEHDKIRLIAAKMLSNDLGRDDLESILNDYIESQTYYYNVVNFLDGYLYAPGKFKDKFISSY